MVRSVRRLKIGKQIIVLKVGLLQKLLLDQSFQQLRDDGQVGDRSFWTGLFVGLTAIVFLTCRRYRHHYQRLFVKI